MRVLSSDLFDKLTHKGKDLYKPTQAPFCCKHAMKPSGRYSRTQKSLQGKDKTVYIYKYKCLICGRYTRVIPSTLPVFGRYDFYSVEQILQYPKSHKYKLHRHYRKWFLLFCRKANIGMPKDALPSIQLEAALKEVKRQSGVTWVKIDEDLWEEHHWLHTFIGMNLSAYLASLQSELKIPPQEEESN